MRKYLLAAAAAAAISSPALARDGTPYVGVEAGVLFDGDTEQDLLVNYGQGTVAYDDAFDIDFKPALDADLIAGYDFGMFRLEAELGYKRLRADKVTYSSGFADDFDITDPNLDIDGKGSILSLMANALLDFGDENGWSFYAGGGLGRARVRFDGDRDSAFAWQGIAGVRKAVSDTVDVGLKYRYFRTGRLNFNDSFNTGDGIIGFGTDGKFRSHSLLASLIFNFAPPPPPMVIAPPPPPPPPPPPATQTCPDGSVILATDMCPAAPVYIPPPPPPAPERG